MNEWATLAGRFAVRIMCALALLFVSFAHKPVVAESHAFTTEMAQYALPDGTIPILCLPSDDGQAQHDGYHPGTGCEACRLTASILLPAPADLTGEPILREIASFVPIRSEAYYRQFFPPGTLPRGPPSGLTG